VGESWGSVGETYPGRAPSLRETQFTVSSYNPGPRLRSDGLTTAPASSRNSRG